MLPTPGVRGGFGAALINPPDTHSISRGQLEEYAPHLGLGYVTAYARSCGWQVEQYDFGDTVRNPPSATALDQLMRNRVFGFTSYTKTFAGALEWAALVRSRKPGAVIVFGGPHATPLAAEILRKNPIIDYVITNDGEIPFERLLRSVGARSEGTERMVPGLAWRDESGVVHHNENPEPVELDALPHPARDYVFAPDFRIREAKGRLEPGEAIMINSSRGCPKRCSFCSIAVMNPRWAGRSVDSVIRELIELEHDFDIDHVTFVDANFFARASRAAAIAEALKAWKSSATWSATATADQIVRHKAELPKVAGNCAFLEIGIESGSDSVLRRFGKRTTVSDNLRAIALLREHRISLDLDFIMYDPWTSLAELEENWAFLVKAELIGYYPHHHLYNAMRVYAGTEAFKQARSQWGEVWDEYYPVPPFENADTGKVYSAMQEIRHGLQLRIDGALGEIQRQVESSDPGNAQLLRELAIRLVHAPYRIFREVLDRAQDNSLDGLGELAAISWIHELLERYDEAISNLLGRRSDRIEHD